ncbi:hypothetical protein IFR04_003645 [Cadophora malorum]|uniref:Uncharacterized protein n=1 Tax=Cadophora malorum TaxID=108018 RepID=A0A8H8BTL6_9HELO|nr:hypothetical protein IFR04_003645 [Cadophora malorum]
MYSTTASVRADAFKCPTLDPFEEPPAYDSRSIRGKRANMSSTITSTSANLSPAHTNTDTILPTHHDMRDFIREESVYTVVLLTIRRLGKLFTKMCRRGFYVLAGILCFEAVAQIMGFFNPIFGEKNNYLVLRLLGRA